MRRVFEGEQNIIDCNCKRFCGYYLRAETTRGRKDFEEIQYSSRLQLLLVNTTLYSKHTQTHFRQCEGDVVRVAKAVGVEDRHSDIVPLEGFGKDVVLAGHGRASQVSPGRPDEPTLNTSRVLVHLDHLAEGEGQGEEGEGKEEGSRVGRGQGIG